MVIQGNRCLLRPIDICDTSIFYAMAHEDVVKRFVPYAYPEDIEEADEMVYHYSKGDLKNDFYLMIESAGERVGCIIAVRTIEKTLDTSVFLAKEYRGRGIMTDAMLTFTDWLRKNTDYKELIMTIDAENTASNRQIKKIGGDFVKQYCNNEIYKISLR